MITESFTLDIGVTAGYHHDNKGAILNFPTFVMNVAKEIYDEVGVYVATVITPTLTTYRPEWGCPPGGERTYQLTGVRNPEFSKDARAWRVAVVMFGLKLGRELKQEAAYLSFKEVDFHYLHPMRKQTSD